MNPPVFIAVFKPTRIMVRAVMPTSKLREVDYVVHIAYDTTGQRWGFVERATPEKRISRGWVKLPTKILNETWEESL